MVVNSDITSIKAVSNITNIQIAYQPAYNITAIIYSACIVSLFYITRKTPHYAAYMATVVIGKISAANYTAIVHIIKINSSRGIFSRITYDTAQINWRLRT